MPRALKTSALQKNEQSKSRGVYPNLGGEKQNDAVDADPSRRLETYTKRKWLEITCGEAPYMATRYDMILGNSFHLRSASALSIENIASMQGDRQTGVAATGRASPTKQATALSGMEILLLARENMLYTYRDYYMKMGEPPSNDFEAIPKSSLQYFSNGRLKLYRSAL